MELDEDIDIERFMDDPVIQALVRQNDELGEAIAREQEKEEKLLGEINRLDVENVQLRKMEKDSHSLMAEVHQNAQSALQHLLEVVDNMKAVLEMSNVTKIDWQSPAKRMLIEKPPPVIARSSPVTRRSLARRESFSVSSSSSAITHRAVSSGYNQTANSRTCRIVLEPLNMASMANENNDEEVVIPNIKTNDASSSNNSSVGLSIITEEDSIPESTFSNSLHRRTEPYVCLERLPQQVIETKMIGVSNGSVNISRSSNTPLAEMSNNCAYSPAFFSTPISAGDQTSLLRELGLEPTNSAKLRASVLGSAHRYVSTRRAAIVRRNAMSELSPPLPSPSTSGTTSRRSVRMLKDLSPIATTPPQLQQTVVKKRKKEEQRLKQDLENNSPKSERPKRKARPQGLKEATLNRKMRRS